MKTSLREEKIKPGLQVQVDWGRDGSFYYHGKVIRKLRKNWLVEVDRGMDYQNSSIPYEAMTINTGFTKEGRRLMDNEKDKQYLFSKEHVNYMQSLLVIPENKTIKHAEIK